MSKIFGANWQTTITGAIQAIIGAIVTGTLVFPKDWSSPREVIIFTLVVIGTAFGVKFASQAKDKNITGGTVQQTADGSVANPAAVGGISKSVSDTFVAKPEIKP